jgi:anhydro-N-acetylmuramic acid kinase
MSNPIHKLANMSEKNSRRIIGLMSGTSLDGLDVAVCKITGFGKSTSIEVEHFETITYPEYWNERLSQLSSKKQIDALNLCLTNNHLAIWHAEQINKVLQQNEIKSEDVDLIASHGHTIFHAPKSYHNQPLHEHSTFQITDGDHLAEYTSIITIHDFRQKHIAAGGEGAPLALFGDYILFLSEEKNRILLNIGGISNISYLPAACAFSNAMATDVGPGNTMMDRWIKQHFPHLKFDEEGRWASTGTINVALLNTLKKHPFFNQALPKTTGPETFNLPFLYEAMQTSHTLELSPEDVMATLNSFTADCIIDAIEKLGIQSETELIVGGGGVKNRVLMENIQNKLNQHVRIVPIEKFNLTADSKEAVLFALLANEMVCGSTLFESRNVSGEKIALNFGKISLPHASF